MPPIFETTVQALEGGDTLLSRAAGVKRMMRVR
jgi:hypothetical protein